MTSRSRLKEIAERATLGRWDCGIVLEGSCGYDLECWRALGRKHRETPRADEHLKLARIDAEFINAFSPSTCLQLLAALEAADLALKEIHLSPKDVRSAVVTVREARAKIREILGEK